MRFKLMFEGYGRTQEFKYSHFKRDNKPRVLKLGTWLHPKTRNLLVGGVNLNYLAPRDIEELRYYLPEILRTRNLRDRYWAGRRLLPNIFLNAYRTYRADRIGIITPGTLKTMTPKELRKIGDQEKGELLSKRREELKKPRIKPEPIPKPEDLVSTKPSTIAQKAAQHVEKAKLRKKSPDLPVPEKEVEKPIKKQILPTPKEVPSDVGEIEEPERLELKEPPKERKGLLEPEKEPKKLTTAKEDPEKAKGKKLRDLLSRFTDDQKQSLIDHLEEE